MRNIVVGVVDSPDGRAALRFAHQLARDDGAALTVVTVYRPVVVDAAVPVAVSPPELHQAVEEEQAHVLAEELADAPGDVDVRCEILVGDPATALCRRAAAADLLVVGRRTSRLKRALGGSVSKACANRAGCPVAIVRADVVLANDPRTPSAP
jgi:nucleotide-binding universal stress UspA family protein